jgi:hypothetical protein
LTAVGPVPIARFFARALFRRRRVAPPSHSLLLVRVALGSLTVDAGHFPVHLGGTVGVIEAIVLGGRLEILVPTGVEMRASIRRGVGGRVVSLDGNQGGGAHILLRGTVVLGRIEVRSGDSA